MERIFDYDKLVVFGDGGGSRTAIFWLKEMGMSSKVKIVLVKEQEKAGGKFQGILVDWEGNIGKYMVEDTALIIASQYFNDIYKRLSSTYGIALQNCFVPNLYCKDSIYPYSDDEGLISFSDERYQQLANMLEDEPSSQLLQRIMKYTGEKMGFEPYEVMRKWNGTEDYWLTIKPVRKHDRAIVLDGGAYTGDSIVPLCNAVGKVENYYAFEPDMNSYSCIEKLPSCSSLYEKLTLVKKGMWKENTSFSFCSQTINSVLMFDDIAETDFTVEVQTIDTMKLEDDVDIFIKMDIEGSELGALQGAENLIRSRKPSMAICVYHKANDLVNIPLYLKSLVPEYKIYLCGGNHTICIAQIE